MSSPQAQVNTNNLPQSPVVTGRFRVGFVTDIGRKRSQNQDNLSVAADIGLFLVADGMGGHQGGEIASQMASEIIPQTIRQSLNSRDWNPRSSIMEAIRSANAAIFDRALKTPNLHGMGTTTTALLFKDDMLTIGHVGDSRCYHLCRAPAGPGAQPTAMIWQMTRDHSLVQEKLRAGLITRDEIKTDRMKNVITRSVGFERDVNVEVYNFRVKTGDIFLICSDGLSGLLNDTGILETVQKNLIAENDIDQTVRQLVNQANQNGGDDNITSIVIEVL